MITLRKKQEVLLMYLREAKSQREIARETGIDRKTVSKYIKEYENKKIEVEQCGDSVHTGELIQELVEAPKYKVGIRQKRVMTKEIEQKIIRYLEENEQKRKKGLRKQLKKPIDIFEALEAEDIGVIYSTVLRTIRQLEKKTKEAFIKGTYLPGDICEFDWGEVKVKIAGKWRKLQMAVFTSAFGNYRMAYLFMTQKMECFQEAHALFFQNTGGVYQTMVYDNMRVAVKRFVGTEKEPTDGLMKLSLYYGFRHRFCNVRKGNEKGHVERSVEVVRRKAFAFQDSFASLEEANEYLMKVCERRNRKSQPSQQNHTAEECLEIEQDEFLPLPPPFDAARIQNVRVDKYSTVVIDQSHYSVPDHLVGEIVKVKAYSNRIIFFHEEKRIAEHLRLTGCHEWSVHLEHYLETLKKKPGALAGSTALQQADKKIKSIYTTYYSSREKEFIELMQFLKEESSIAEIEQSITKLKKINASHVTTDKIKILCAKNREIKPLDSALSKETKDISEQSKAHLKMYDALFKTEEVGNKEAIA
ncbi:IS21 family transposase [Aneurinibacillus sp. Ricciae_BoGa-3]|uniref:IS21 family transposase n=1 Tax=Aneurinibacillus sp. Ricciae_BoGa-3 TaxID=3022697 RepID=UPI0023409211|nr:IS21 family transposase [Aneurinibacillus sp. Ricciae_BoGa-3]WCK53272.1 IS21 family transposase [Aneurinibacillus sp. Ricciae_BoGa-3]WCK55093.1 IS21 family transposase [Aneurinibacillus sp. Ricciae_BoGa-3]